MSDVLILGGGLSGAAAGALLARSGRAVRIIERSSGPHHKVCGEFLSIEAQQHLAALGVDARMLGGVPIDRVEIVRGRQRIDARLPFMALGISRYRLDEAMLAAADAAGVTIERGVRATAVTAHGVATSAGERTGARMLLATGKHGLRGVPDGAAVDSNAFAGFKMHLRLTAEAQASLAGRIVLILFDGGYAGLQMIEGGIANLCAAVRRDRLAAFGGRWEGLYEAIGQPPRARAMLAGAEPLFERPVTIANLAYGRLHRGNRGEALLRLGDQGAMTASLSGDGMAIALRSAALACDAITGGAGTGLFHHRQRQAVGRQIRRAMALQRASECDWLARTALVAGRYMPMLVTGAARMTRLPEWRSSEAARYDKAVL